MKKIIPIFAILLIAVAGIAFYMGQQTAVASQGEDSTQQDTVEIDGEEYKTNDEIIDDVYETLLKDPEAYIVQYEDLSREVLSGFLIVYLDASEEKDFDENLDKMSMYERVHHISAWENLGLRVPDNSEALYMSWKFEYCGGYNYEDETPETQPEQKPEQKPESKPEQKPEQKPTNNDGGSGNGGSSDGFIDFSGLPVNEGERPNNSGGGEGILAPYRGDLEYSPGVGFTG